MGIDTLADGQRWGKSGVMSDSMTSGEEEVKRIIFSGTIWFGASIIAVAVPFAGLLISGWRPTELPAGLALLWWIGCAVLALGIFCFAWSGCPVLEVDVPTSDRNKVITIRSAVVLFLIGSAVVFLAVLLGPGSVGR